MTMKHFVVYEIATGRVTRSGTCQERDLEAQAMPGEAVMEATSDAVIVAEINLDPLREHASATVDEEADAFCLRFITGGVTQSMRYQQKLAEAKAWRPGANPSQFPFLSLEAAATGVPIDQLVAIVLAKAAEWLIIGAKVEAARMKAKVDIGAAQSAAQIHAASQVDWSAVVS